MFNRRKLSLFGSWLYRFARRRALLPAMASNFDALATSLWDAVSNIIKAIRTAISKLEWLSTQTDNTIEQEFLRKVVQNDYQFIHSIECWRHTQAGLLNEQSIYIALPHIQETLLHCFHYVGALAIVVQCAEDFPHVMAELETLAPFTETRHTI